VFINLLNDITRARKSGFDAHLVKPFDLDELEKLMGAYGKCPAAS
jgi:CheY-like chemotaxis protein